MSSLRLLPHRLAIYRLSPSDAIPAWATSGPFFSVTRTGDELSIVCAQAIAPPETKCETGWRAFQVAGPLDFSLTGILSSLAAPLAAAGIGIFAISTFDTDYVLLKEERVSSAMEVLRAAGHQVS